MLVEYFLHDWNNDDTKDTTQRYEEKRKRCIDPGSEVTAVILIMHIVLMLMIIDIMIFVLMVIFRFSMKYSLYLILLCDLPW